MYKWKEVISYATQRRFLGGKETKVKRAAIRLLWLISKRVLIVPRFA